MKSMHTDKPLFKALNIVLLYVMLLDVFSPVVHAGTLVLPYEKGELDALLAAGNNAPVAVPANSAAIGTSLPMLDQPAGVEIRNAIPQGLAAVSSSLSGPGQPESSGFSLGSTDGMVDKFTGDFSYSIPLADVEGYPIVLNYSSGLGMNTDASWVGLGWDLNVGAVSREMRGLPDEFNGQQTIDRTFNQAEDLDDGKKKGAFAGVGGELGGVFAPSLQLTALWGKYSSTYIGKGKTFDLNLNARMSVGGISDVLFIAPSFGFGYSSDNKRGIGVSHTFGLSAGLESKTQNSLGAGVTFGRNFNSRSGLTSRTIGFSTDLDINFLNSVSSSGGYSASSTISYGTATSIPSQRFNALSKVQAANRNFYFAQGIGYFQYRVGAVFNSHVTTLNAVTLGAGKQLKQPALGYFHSSKRKAYETAASSNSTNLPLMDFNRSNDYEFSTEMTNLPFSIQAYDIFRANALGLGATFRGRRQDIGTYYDPTAISRTILEGTNLTAGATVKAGVTLEVAKSSPENDGTITTGNMTLGTGVNALEFAQEAKGNNFDAKVYFKGVGETTPESMADFDALGGAVPTQFQISESGEEEVNLTTKIFGSGFLSSANSSVLNQDQSLARATFYEPFTAEQYALKETTYSSYPYNVFATGIGFPIARVASDALAFNAPNAKNHLGAVEITSTDGLRYVFSTPAYDLLNSQVSFCVTGKTGVNGIVTYDTGDNTTSNSKGISHFFDKTNVPAYPHSFLLSEMLSPDYVDRTNDGPTLDDIGSYYKFNYTRVYGYDPSPGSTLKPYKWKYPMGNNKALMNRGLLGTEKDDMANYSYGEKEIWYTHSIESRNMVAEFYLSDRKDGYGVSNENGVLDVTLPLKRLDSILVYNRSERFQEGANAIPLQVIEFEYSYELCKELPSNINGTGAQSGKLTLKKIRSRSGSSTEMGLYTYEFTYDASNNPNFSYGNCDAWGQYKLSDPARPNDLFPYPTQMPLDADASASAWKLLKIKTPANGLLEVQYEADHYATVQNKRPMKHIDMKGLTNLADLTTIQGLSTWNGTSGVYKTFHSDITSYSSPAKLNTQAYFSNFGSVSLALVPNNIIVFKLDDVINAPTKLAACDSLKKYYFSNPADNSVLKELYLKLHVKVKDAVEEFIPAFCTVSENYAVLPPIGVMPEVSSGAGYQYGYVMIEPVQTDEKQKNMRRLINPLQKYALEFVRRNLPDKLYGACPTCTANNMLDKAVVLGGEDVNMAMIRQGWVPEIITDYTSVRLYLASNKKYGGGTRVKSLVYKDNWQAISGEYDGIYRWNYEYGERSVGYGNASFEPQGMIDECPFYRWNTYYNDNKHYPDESRFTPTPVTGLLFPAPVVGYEKVKVSIAGTDNLGYSISEFHTSRTHPVIESLTAIDKSSETHHPKNILSGKTTDRYGLSQGFFIHTNDYHGKPHQTLIYDIDEDPGAQPVAQSRTTYTYAGVNDKFKMADRRGVINEERIALEYDIHADSRYVENKFEYEDFGFSFRVKIILSPPFVIPFVLPTYSRSSRTEAFYAHALIKHLNTSSVITGIQTENFGSVNNAENLVYDRFAGKVILSSLMDEYDDKLYSLDYPSHWGYHELRDIASTKTSPTAIVSISATGTIGSSYLGDPYNSLSPGDLVAVTTASGAPTAWIAKRNAGTPQQTLYLMKEDGTAFTSATGTHTLKILSTNRDNRLNEVMQSIVTKKNPLTTSGELAVLQLPTEIISAGSVTYRDRNNFKCGIPSRMEEQKNNNQVAPKTTVNPYLYGTRGDLVADAQYAWQSERINASHAYKTRFDGTYTDYYPMYRWANNTSSNQWVNIFHTAHPNYTAHAASTGPKWRKLGEQLVFDQFGKLLESKDQTEVRSAVLYGYNRDHVLVPVAQAVNARQQDIAFDGFEDYNYYSSATVPGSRSHLDFKGVSGASASTVVRHSGLSSLRVNHSTTVSVSKKAINYCDISSKQDSLVNRFRVDSCSCIKDFEPTPGKYVIGAWVYTTDPTLSETQVQVAVTGQPTLTFNPAGPVLDGWQRVEGVFTVTAGATVTVSLKNNSTFFYGFFDDLRIHPQLAAMTTMVCDPKTLLPLAMHDAYNFTTFYNYDENLKLVRMRVETTEGIKTISESEMGGVKQPKQP